jgi:type 1 glutamine amidotransferase
MMVFREKAKVKRRALILCGGWDGHEPKLVAARYKTFLEGENFEVEIAESVDCLKELDALLQLDIILADWTGWDGAMPREYTNNVSEAIGSGVGMAGCHGGMCDSFRNDVNWQFITGANWVSHPGGDGTPYTVNIRSVSNPIVTGISDFEVSSEQYYLHTDPANEVLATTRFPVAHWYHAANGVVDVPQVWCRRWGWGRVFYNALGHHDDVFDKAPQAWEIMKRGILWAADGKTYAVEHDLKVDYWKSEKKMF